MIARRSSKGGIKACRIHDVFWDFCSAKLEGNSFLMQEGNLDGISIHYGDFQMQTKSLLYYYKSNRELLSFPLLYKDTPSGVRDEFLSERLVFEDKPPRGRGVFTDGGVGTRSSQPRQFDYGSILQYKLLRVLDLGNVRVESSADTSDLIMIAELVHLRYLAIQVRTAEIPSEISNLRNLETLILTGTIGKIILPEAVWNLVSLRHALTFHSFFTFQYYSKEFFDNFSQLANLVSISVISPQNGNDVEKFLWRLPNIRKLGCRFSNSWDDSTVFL
ncbi:hypothetical protein ACH5RR_034459 [Cinchona calisaya]|uniref:Disease resistance R13L4/SHOC-2-like LRR domain-containing protein n=1 Tax=Cinchona calisaya TaxID=153742 RepID=A0ABD2YGF4_9GENT